MRYVLLTLVCTACASPADPRDTTPPPDSPLVPADVTIRSQQVLNAHSDYTTRVTVLEDSVAVCYVVERGAASSNPAAISCVRR